MTEGKIYIHTIFDTFVCDKILKIISDGVSDSAEALMYNVVDGECSHETLNTNDIKNIICGNGWILLDVQSFCDLLHTYNTNRGISNRMLEARAATICSLEKKIKTLKGESDDEQEGIFVFLKDGSERLIKSGVRYAFDNIHDMFYVMDKEDETIAGFESDFVRGFMPVNRRQQRCD